MKSFTDLEQSKKLAEILPMESVDMYYPNRTDTKYQGALPIEWKRGLQLLSQEIPCWSLAALLEYMNRNFYNISLNYCGSEYTISFDDGERYKTITKDYSIDTAFEMIVWLKETNRI